MKRVLVLLLILSTYATNTLANPPSAELVNVTKISERAPHSAFTDLIRWNDQLVCAFREGRGHMSTDGRIRVLTSKDGEEWKSSAVVTLDDLDLRDAGLSIAPDGRLMLIGGMAPRKSDGATSSTGTFVSFSEDAENWSKPAIVLDVNRWLWRVTWHDGKAYGVAYASGDPNKNSKLYVSSDGTKFEPLVQDLLAPTPQALPTEAVVRFDADGTSYCLQRRDGKENKSTAMLGTSKPPYRDWEWTDLGIFFGGPNFIKLPNGRWIAAGRIMGDDGPHTHLAWLDVKNKKLEPVLQLPSGGDTSYPGLVWHDDRLWVSYYSSHEKKTSIYFAEVKLNGDQSSANAGKSVPARTVSDTKSVALSDEQAAACDKLGLDKDVVQKLLQKRLYEFTEPEVDVYLQFLNATEPDLRKRIAHLARKNISQPYELYLLGEMPFEPYDPQPIYCLGKSDCVVFSEHTYAMALAHNWPSFMKMLQRIRYRDGQIGVATRNHYTEADWNKSNRWLVEDITQQVAGDKAITFKQAIDRKNFFKKRYKLDVDVPVQQFEDVFIPYEAIDRAKPELQDGDFVNIIRGTVSKDAPESDLSNTFGGSAWAGHVGMIVRGDGDNGEVHLIHSTIPTVREEPIDEYIARSTKDNAENDAKGKPRLLGFKFLRLQENPMKNLREIDGKDAPKVTLPDGGEAKF